MTQTSIFNFVALKNPIIFFKLLKIVHAVVGSFDEN